MKPDPRAGVSVRAEAEKSTYITGSIVSHPVKVMCLPVCSTCDGNELKCTDKSCEKDCVVNEWAEWSECSSTCGGGMAERARTFTPGTEGGAPCPCEEDLTEKKYCNTDPCKGR